MQKKIRAVLIVSALTMLIVSHTPTHSRAASCCGGGSASFLVLPKLADAEVAVSLAREAYDGFWDEDGAWRPDPPDSDLGQYRLSAGVAYRLADRWQGSVSIPYVWNRNRYSGSDSNTDGPGDAAIGVRYETFDNVMCLTRIERWRDLLPAVYLGAGLTLPTGVSPYDDVKNSFDITGRGFYRFDANILVEKTVFPWNLGAEFTYGVHLERDVNREYGAYVEPYRKKLGDRWSGSVRLGYGQDLPWGGLTLTPTISYSEIHEGKSEIDSRTDPSSGFMRRSVGGSVALATFMSDWIVSLSYDHSIRESDWGKNFPATETVSLGVTHVFYP